MTFRSFFLVAPLVGAFALTPVAGAQFGDLANKVKDKVNSAKKPATKPSEAAPADATPADATRNQPGAAANPSPNATGNDTTAGDAKAKDAGAGTQTSSGAAGGKDEGGGGKDYQDYKARQAVIQANGGPKSAGMRVINADNGVGSDAYSASRTSMTMSDAGQKRASDPALKQLAARIYRDEEVVHQGAATVMANAGAPAGDREYFGNSFAGELSGKEFDRKYIEDQDLNLFVQVSMLKSRKAQTGKVSPDTMTFISKSLTTLSADKEALDKMARAAGITVRN